MNSNFKRNLFVGFGVSFIILAISSVASFLSIRSLLSSNDWVNHTQEVIYNLNSGQAVMTDAQTSMRGYLLTGSEDFLEQYNDAPALTDAYFDEVAVLTRDNPLQQRALAELRPVRKQFYKYLSDRVTERRDGKLSLAEDINVGRRLMADMRSLIKRMEKEEQKLLKDRIASSNNYGSYSTVLIVAAALLSLFITGFYFTKILADYSERAKLLLELEKKDEETAERIRVISGVSGEISEGNYDIRLDSENGDALGVIGESLNSMAESLGVSFKSLSDNEWKQAGIAGLNNVMIGEKTIAELTKDIIDYLAQYTGSTAGVLYIPEGEGLLLSAGYGYIPNKGREYIQMGEGLTGQAASSGKILEVKVAQPDDIKITYALGEIKPAHIVAIPLFDIKLEGVAELASVKEYSARARDFFEAAADNIGIVLRSAQSRKRVQELLEETQAQSEELKAQHSELEGMNAELEAQTQKLQASEEELRVQQEELQQTNEELAERSTLLEERNMEIQKKSEDLELTTRYKSEFLANMSHELRTPLNSILLLSRLLSENNDENMNGEQVEFARVIQSSGTGLLGLIDEILDLSKIEAGKMDLEFMEVSVKDVADSLKNLFTEISKEKGITFNVVTDNAPLVIKTDKMRLEQILKNLVSNAIKFTSEGAVTLEIKKQGVDDKRVAFSVKDTGIGIPLEKQPLIFEAFQQADGSTKRKYGGTGLGLSISRELAKLLRGEITLKSKVDQGSEFTLTLPVIATELPQPEAVNWEKKNAPAAPADDRETDKDREIKKYLSPFIPEDVDDDKQDITQKDKVILIVEDDVNFAKSLLDFTRKRGYKGIVSVRGDHALNLALVYKPVGVLLDIQLPIKSGWEVMEELKNNLQTRHIPVHIMSSHKLRQESLLKGAVNFLDKPAAYEQIPEVFRRIEHVINKESQKVLIIEDNPKHAKALALFLESFNINSEIKSEVSDGVDALKKEDVDCVILDMGIPDRQTYELLENIRKNPELEKLPVIVFTGKSLSMKEELKIKKYADSIIIKTAHSYQRMLDEVSLFLHLVEDDKKDGAKKDKRLNMMNNILHDKTVLVVDDDVRNIYSLTKALETLKMNVITAIDGKEALKMLDQHPDTDVVLLDMMMPNMDGYETATHIRQNNKTRNLPVIAVTAKAMTGDREKCINAGASDYITKPVDVDQLLSLLRVWLYDKA
jgi:signal transduction histidine kinase/DNA-binding response OmpR family regulator/CHASE3 domain sensor protein